MSVATAMLLDLLLSAICLAAPAAQDPAPPTLGEPSLRWNGETEDAYRRALHLWKVRGKAGEAADILLGLADSSEVTQIAGQSSWVLALAAQCLAEAGRGEEVATLLPGIERGAQGTALEAHVAERLAGIRTQVGGAELDEAFLNSLIELLEEEYDDESRYLAESGRQSTIAGYQRAVLPYLLAVIDRWQEGKVRQQAAALSLHYGLARADAPFVDGLIQRLEAMSTLSFLAVVRGGISSADDEATGQLIRLWSHFARSADGERVQFAKWMLRRHVEDGDPEALRVVESLLVDADPRYDEELIPEAMAPRPPAALFELVIAAARNPAPQVRERARNSLMPAGALEVLASFIADGEREDAVRYLLALIVRHLPQVSETYSSGQERVGVGLFLARSQFAALYGIASRSFAQQDAAAELEPHADFAGFAWTRPHLADPEFRTLLAIAAAAVQDPTGFELAYASGIPSDEAAVLIALKNESWLPDAFLARLPECGRLGVADLAFDLLQRLRPHEMSIELAEAWGDPYIRDRYMGLVSHFIDYGHIRDATLLCNRDELSTQQRSKVLQELCIRTDDWWKEPEEIFRAWQRLPDTHLRDQVSKRFSLSLTETPVPAGLDAPTLLRLLTALHDAGLPCWIGTWIAATWDGVGREAVESFATDEPRLRWFVDGGVGPSQFLYALRRGAPAAWFADDEGALAVWSEPENQDLVDAARILFAREDEVAIRLGLYCLEERPAAADALWDLAAPYGADPRFASHASRALADTSFREALLQLRLAAWELPGLLERRDLFRAIAWTGDASAVPILLKATADADMEIAATAREALDRLKAIEEQRAFWRAWQATGIGGSPEAALLVQARSENAEVRLAAIRALGAMQSENALPLLISLLEDPDPQVVAAARAALAWLEQAPAPAEPPK